MKAIEGFILIGGASRRMGSDKSRLLLEGHTFAELVAAVLSQIARSVTVVGRDADEFGCKSVTDVYPQWGALGGLHAALAACQTEWALITACDLPFVSKDLFARMVALSKGFEAVAPVQSDGFPQPLCALYRVDPCLPRASRLIQAGERRPIVLLESVETRWLPFDELADLDGSDRFFDNINTPDDYIRVTAKGAA